MICCHGQGILAAAGWQKGLFAERETMRPRRLRPEERALFAPYVDSTAATQSENALIET